MKTTSKKRAQLLETPIKKQLLKSKQFLELWLPQNFDPSILVGGGERAARICYFLQLLATSPFDKRGFVPINITRLRKAISRPAINAALEQLGSIIEINHSYLDGSYPKGYRFSKAYRNQPCVKHRFHCPGLIKRLSDNETIERDSATPLEKNVYHDVKKLSLSQVRDLDSFVDKIKPKAGVKNEIHRKNCIHHSAECIIKGEFGRVTTSEKSGRVHCLPNRTSSEIRSLYLLDGERTVEIDLASSQPYFLASICKIQELTNAVSCGEFYSRINNQLFHPVNFDDKQAYKAFKTAILSIIYACDKYPYWESENYKHAHLVEALHTAYPMIRSFIKNYRKTHGDTALAIAMQSLESGVFIYDVLTQLHREGIAAIPIHDAILCKISDADYIEDLLRKALIKKTGITPKLNISFPDEDHCCQVRVKGEEPKPSFGREHHLKLLEDLPEEIMGTLTVQRTDKQLPKTG